MRCLLDLTYNPSNFDGRHDELRTLAIQADGKLVAGGEFTKLGGQARKNIGRLDTIGQGPPVITSQPQELTIASGGFASFKVSATFPWTYRWLRNGVNLLDGDRIQGARSGHLIITNVQPTDAGIYSVVVSNYYGQAVSSNATLVIRSGVGGQLVTAVDLGAPVTCSPAVGQNGYLYVGNTAGDIRALNLSNGQLSWQTNLAEGVEECLPSISVGADNTVYVGLDNRVCSLEPADGSVRQVFALTNLPLVTGIAIANDGTLYAGWGDELHALSVPDLTSRWYYPCEAFVGGSPAVGADGTVYFGSHDNRVRALDPASGDEIWQRGTGNYNWVITGTAIGFGGVSFAGTAWGDVFAVDPTGEPLWAFPAGEAVTCTPTLGLYNKLYVGCTNGSLFALDVNTREKWWEFSAQGAIQSSPAVGADGTVYFGSDDGCLYALNGETGAVEWQFLTDGAVKSSPVIWTNGIIYFGSEDGRLYAVRAKSPAGLASSPWPMYMQNPAHTARAPGAPPTVPVIIQQPQSQTNHIGTDAMLAVRAIGAGELGYQWRRNGADLSDNDRLYGSTNRWLDIFNLQTNDAGSYTVVVSNVYGSVTSAVAVLVVEAPGGNESLLRGAYIMQEYGTELPDPWDWTARHLLTFDGMGGGTWTNLSDSNDSSYIGVDTYWLDNLGTVRSHGSVGQVSRDGGVFAMADTDPSDGDITIHVGVKRPFGLSTNILQGRYLMVEYGTDPDPWTSLIQIDFDGAGSATYTILLGSNSDHKNRAETYNLAADGTLIANRETGVSSQAQTGVVSQAGSIFVLTDTLTNPVVTNLDLSLHVGLKQPTNMSPAKLQGRYLMVEYGANQISTNVHPWSHGVWASRSQLDFDGAGNGSRLTLQASNGITNAVPNFTYSVGANGLLSMNGMAGVVSADGNMFTLVDTNLADTNLSLHIGLRLPETNQPPVITLQPQSQTNAPGTAACLNILATGTWPIAYQWRRNGTNVADGSNISGAATANLVVSGVQASDAADYSIVVTNNYGSVTSSIAHLTVVLPSARDHLSWGLISSNHVRLTITGTAGRVLKLQGSPDLFHWRVLGTYTNQTGTPAVTIPQAVGRTAYFYRTFYRDTPNPPVVPAPVLSGPRLLQTGRMRFDLNATPGSVWRVEGSPDLLHWGNYGTVTNLGAALAVTNTSVSRPGAYFYRAAQP